MHMSMTLLSITAGFASTVTSNELTGLALNYSDYPPTSHASVVGNQTRRLRSEHWRPAGRTRKRACHEAVGARIPSELNADHLFTSTAEFGAMMNFIRQRHDLDSLRKSFNKDGFIVFKPEIPDEVLEGAAQFTQKVYEACIVGAKPAPAECRNMHQDKYTHIPAVRELALNYHIRAMLAALHSHEAYPFQTLNYPLTSLARTHSDYVHFAAHPLPLMSAAWVALIDVDPKAGPVFYYPGSHRFDHYNMQDFGLQPRQDHPHNYAKYQDIQTKAMEESGLEKRLAIIPKGHCLIWSANLVHGGPPAETEALKRFSQVTHYFFRRSDYNWAPIMSDLTKDRVTYYDEESVNKKWAVETDLKTQDQLFAMSKFRESSCEDHQGAPDSTTPCDMVHRFPYVMSHLLEHHQKQGDVLM